MFVLGPKLPRMSFTRTWCYPQRMSAKVEPRSYALKALDEARKDLCGDKYLVPVAFIVMDDEVLDFNLQFEDREQKLSVYSKLVELAKEKKARAIITVNDDVADIPGNDCARLSSECIFVTVSGPNIQTSARMDEESDSFLAYL